LEAPVALSKKYRKMVYDYERQLPDKQKTSNNRRALSKIPGFKEAKAKFGNKTKVSQDRLRTRDAFGYIKSEERTPHYSTDLYLHNKDVFLEGLREIQKIHRSKLSDDKKFPKILKVMETIRTFHVFRSGKLSESQYMDAWDMAYVQSMRGNRYNHKKFVSGTKRMLEGIQHFDKSFVKKMKEKYLK